MLDRQCARVFADLNALLFLIEYVTDVAHRTSDPVRIWNREPFDGKRRKGLQRALDRPLESLTTWTFTMGTSHAQPRTPAAYASTGEVIGRLITRTARTD